MSIFIPDHLLSSPQSKPGLHSEILFQRKKEEKKKEKKGEGEMEGSLVDKAVTMQVYMLEFGSSELTQSWTHYHTSVLLGLLQRDGGRGRSIP